MTSEKNKCVKSLYMICSAWDYIAKIFISEGFIKGGFSKSLDKGFGGLQPDETGEEYFIGIEFNHLEMDGHEYIDCDADVVTASIHMTVDMMSTAM